MICCFPVYQEDVTRLMNLLVWIRQLGGCSGHDALIVVDANTCATHVFALQEEASRSFRNTDFVSTERSVKGWIHGANTLFLTAAKACRQRNQPWLFLEPDAVPLRVGWLDKIEIHYRFHGARYFGRIVPCDTPGLPPKHFTGVGVYPPEAIEELADIIQQRPTVAFDLSTASKLAPIAINSHLFQHLWGEREKPPTFSHRRVPGTEVFDLGYLNPDAVLFHRNKDGTLISHLRIQAGMKQRTFIQLGRVGDIILSLPALKWIYDHEGLMPRFIVAREMASVLDGVSYIEPYPLDVHWWFGLHKAYEFARRTFGDAIVLQCHGYQWPVDTSQPTFMHASHFRSGVPMELFYSIPMVFDRRDLEREKHYIPNTSGKPFIMVNTCGFSSPFPYRKELYSALSSFDSKVVIINMEQLQLPRIYDLLGLFDRAIGTIHIDTATLHLAHASPTPYIGFRRGGWSSSTPRGNCVLSMDYSEFPSRSHEVIRTVESWIRSV